MNEIYRFNESVPLTPEEITAEANINRKGVCQFRVQDFQGENSRIVGNHCFCNGNGKFDLLPANDPDVLAGGKRYMICRICGCCSHL